MDTRTQHPRRLLLTLALPMAACALFVLSIGWRSPALAVGRDTVGIQGRLPAAPQVTSTPCGNGAGWNIVPAPDDGSYTNGLYGVAALSQSDAWVVGEQYSYAYSSYVPLIEHWNGTAWSVVQAAQYGVSLRAVTAIAPDDVWAVGLGLAFH